MSISYFCYVCRRPLPGLTYIQEGRCDFFLDQQRRGIRVTRHDCMFPPVGNDTSQRHKEACTPAGFLLLPADRLPYLPPLNRPTPSAPLGRHASSSNTAPIGSGDPMDVDTTPRQRPSPHTPKPWHQSSNQQSAGSQQSASMQTAPFPELQHPKVDVKHPIEKIVQ